MYETCEKETLVLKDL